MIRSIIITNISWVIICYLQFFCLISISPNNFYSFLGTLPIARTTIGITVIFMSPIFFCSLTRSWYLFIFRFLSLSFSTSMETYFHLVNQTQICSSNLNWKTRYSLKEPEKLSVLLSRRDSGLCILKLFYVQISISSTIPSKLLSLPSHVFFLFFCSFCTIYLDYFVFPQCLKLIFSHILSIFFLWYNYFLWHYFVLLLLKFIFSL